MITTPKGQVIKLPQGCGLIKISEVDRRSRFRKDFGDIKTLAKTIVEIGLEEPIVITPKKKLIDGDRRIEAFVQLGLESIPFVTLDVDDVLAAEVVANGTRKEFNLMETSVIIERIEKSKAAEYGQKRSNLLHLFSGRTVELVSKITGHSPRQIEKIKNIAKAVKEDPKYEKYLHDIEKKKKSVDTVHKLVTIKQRNLPKIPPPTGIYDLISIDWPYEFENKTIRGGALLHYDLMKLEDICRFKLPIADNAVVFMWIPNSMKFDRVLFRNETKSTMNHILDAHQLVVGTEFIWEKQKPAPGNYNLQYHETLLLCFKGKKIPPMKRFSSIIKADAGPHSSKPKIFYDMMLEMYPERSAYAMFERIERIGFIGYGNEFEKTN